MAIDDHVPVMKPSLSVSVSSSSSTSSSSFRFSRRRCPIQVATNNSSTFIQLPTNSRQKSPLVPTYRSRTSLSTTRPSSIMTETEFLFNPAKLSFNAVNNDHKRSHSHQRFNPILNNPFLNQRKESLKSRIIKTSTDFSHTTVICLPPQPLQTSTDCLHTNKICLPSSQPLQNSQNDDEQTENFTDSPDLITEDNEDIDQSKRDYVTRWLCAIRQGVHTPELSFKTKRSKKRNVQF